MSGECDKCGKYVLDCECFTMSREEWELIHKKFDSCAISMVMGYKHGRLTSIQLMDLIEGYCEASYKLGTFRMSGECDKCGEHCLECTCRSLCRRQQNDPKPR